MPLRALAVRDDLEPGPALDDVSGIAVCATVPAVLHEWRDMLLRHFPEVPRVVVEPGATVTESVVFADTVVRAGATVTRSIVDTGCELLDGAVVGNADVDLTDPDAVPIVGRDCELNDWLADMAGAILATGACVVALLLGRRFGYVSDR